jgi:ubiquitin fusion degradation protein 1
MAMYQAAMQNRMGGGARQRRFDEYYRVYPTAMMPGPEREAANHGGKMFLPASALDKLSQLHVTYPMLFELIKSTDLPLGSFIKLQPQHVNFLEISDPKAVLETAFRNFSCLTVGDVFTFSYNDTIYEIAVLEVKPDNSGSHAVSVQETDLEVDFAPPVGYQEPSKTGSGTSTPRSIGSEMARKGGMMHAEGTMAQAINYSAIAPDSDAVAKGHAKASSNFGGSGQRLVAKKGKSSLTATPASTPGTSTPIPGAGPSTVPVPKTTKRRNGPQPLRLPPGKLFFGYEIKPLQNKEKAVEESEQGKKQNFSGEGQTLRKKK